MLWLAEVIRKNLNFVAEEILAFWMEGQGADSISTVKQNPRGVFGRVTKRTCDHYGLGCSVFRHGQVLQQRRSRRANGPGLGSTMPSDKIFNWASDRRGIFIVRSAIHAITL